jgi:hypothetical protein
LCASTTLAMLLSCNKDENSRIENKKTELTANLGEDFDEYSQQIKELSLLYQSQLTIKTKEIRPIPGGGISITFADIKKACVDIGIAIGGLAVDMAHFVADKAVKFWNWVTGKKNKVDAAISYANNEGGPLTEILVLPEKALDPFRRGGASIELMYEITQLNITHAEFLSSPVTYAMRAWIDSGLEEKYGNNSYTKTSTTLSEQDWADIDTSISRFYRALELNYDSTNSSSNTDFIIDYYMGFNSPNTFPLLIQTLAAYQVCEHEFNSLLSVGGTPEMMRNYIYQSIHIYCNSIGMGASFNDLVVLPSTYSAWSGISITSSDVMTKGELYVQMASNLLHKYLLIGQMEDWFQLQY